MSCNKDASGISDISGVIHAATSDSYLLTQEDFTSPYVISKPGIYTLTEDIKINFYPKPYDIFDVNTLLKSRDWSNFIHGARSAFEHFSERGKFSEDIEQF